MNGPPPTYSTHHAVFHAPLLSCLHSLCARRLSYRALHTHPLFHTLHHKPTLNDRSYYPFCLCLRHLPNSSSDFYPAGLLQPYTDLSYCLVSFLYLLLSVVLLACLFSKADR